MTGATASGKTKLSIELAKAIKADIICADSRIVYKDLDIVSAKPTEQEKENIKHHLIDIVSPEKEFSAGDFVSHSKEILSEKLKNNENIIIQGGTWFYIKSLLDEKALPECPINHELREELTIIDTNILWEKLNQLDSKRAELIHPNNKDKIIRSIEMCQMLGQPISEYQRQNNEKYDVVWYMKDLSREVLYERINKRVDIMLDMGLFEEWKNNKEKYPNSKVISNTIGYSEFFDFENKIYESIDIAIEKIKQHTRNFAKRQLTYFRSNTEIKLINDVNDILGDLGFV